jgi:hypothetical protein
MVAFADEPNDPVEELLRLGERQGYLTYEMLNERLPDEVGRIKGGRSKGDGDVYLSELKVLVTFIFPVTFFPWRRV